MGYEGAQHTAHRRRDLCVGGDMTITLARPIPRRRPRRERWHRQFIWSSRLQFVGDPAFYHVRFEMVLRRWSVTRGGWLYRPATPANILSLLGTDRRPTA
jgi:hypothetical protein